MASDFSSMPPGSNPVTNAVLSLRPMSVGELFDRAFTLYFRHIVALVALLVVVVVPFAIVQYFATKDVLDAYIAIMTNIFKNPSKPPDITGLQSMSSAIGPLTALNYLLAIIGLPLAQAAVIVGISRAYLGLPVRFADCYRIALGRWLYVLLLIVLWLVTLFLAVFTLIFAFVIIAIGFAGLITLLKTIGIVIAAILGIALFVAFMGLSVMAYMAFASSFIATVLERVDPIHAFGSGFARIFGGGLFWRSLGLSLAMLAIYLGFGLLTLGLAGGLFVLTKSPFLYVVVANLANLFFLTFALIVVALYYYDVRIRREGFDLQLLADQLAVTPATPAMPA